MSYPLVDIKTYRVPPGILFGPGLAAMLLADAEELVALYRAGVAKRTGRLAASAHASVQVGGRRNDRWVGKVTVGDGLEYAVLHEFGAKDQASRHRAARELAEAVEVWKGARRT
ncbi:hypothetical protein [Mycolicibacterium sp. J2]|uniref:hypothetical protein n=1 Tax=Mycolicibacterium sp. J2 TaxID=2993511 RepID=UPI00224AF6EF|nr:hypothetical protein [Mycolicibacterium sp. J2]MCX2716092.1 hypothetical protein [Mycolicibacterium sp. J2]